MTSSPDPAAAPAPASATAPAPAQVPASRKLAALCAVLAVLLIAHAVVACVLATGWDGVVVDGWQRVVPIAVDLTVGVVLAGLAGYALAVRFTTGRRELLTTAVLAAAVVAAAVRAALLNQPVAIGEIAAVVVVSGACRIGSRSFSGLATLAWVAAAGAAAWAATRPGADAVLASALVPTALTLAAATAAGAAVQSARSRSGEALAAVRREIQEAGVRDALTHCANRQGLEMVAAPIIDHARREGQALHCLVVDVDGFSAVNEAAGLAGGDAVLVAVSEALRAGVRGTDVVARWDSDRFVVFGPGTGTSPLELERRVHSALQTRPPLPGTEWSERVSIGSATLVPWDEGDLDALIRKGEQDLGLRRSLRRRAGLIAEQAGVTTPPVSPPPASETTS